MCCKNKILSYREMDEEWNQETAEKSLPLKVDYEIFVGLAVFCIIVLAMSFILGNQENTLINLTLLEVFSWKTTSLSSDGLSTH